MVVGEKARIASRTQGAAASNPHRVDGRSGRSIRLNTVQNQLHDAAQIGVIWFTTLHKPLEHVRVFALEQFLVSLLIFFWQ